MAFDLNNNRTAKDVIDEAIKDNNSAKVFLYGLAAVFAVVGIAVLIVGVYREDSVTSLLGVISSSLFWPAINSVRKTRKENIAIRLLEVPLSQSSSSEEAAKMLKNLCNDILKL